MSAVIDMSNGRANMAYVGETPWHGLGVTMPDDASLDQWRVEAGLDWTANRAKVQYQVGDQLVQGESEIIYRSDTHAELGVVTKRYKPVQPKEVVHFFEDLCKNQGFTMETLGGLNGGKRVWALARTGESFRLKGQDEVGAYVLLATSFDGSMATRAQFTTVRVVCQNTLSMAMESGKNFVSITHSTDFDATKVKYDLGIYRDTFKEMEEQAGLLSERGVNKSAAVRFLTDIMVGENAKVEDLSTRAANNIQNVLNLFDGKAMGSDYKSASGTLWGLVNSVTEYVDHHQGYKQNSRLNNAWFGKGDTMKTQAFKKALALAEAA